jgi:hypothetical protein
MLIWIGVIYHSVVLVILSIWSVKYCNTNNANVAGFFYTALAMWRACPDSKDWGLADELPANPQRRWNIPEGCR